MDEKLKASFIPKQPLHGQDSLTRGRRSSGKQSPILTISLVVLFLSVLSLGGMYLWEHLMKKTVNEKSERLVSMQSKIAQANTEEYKRLNNRLKASAEQLSSHKVIHPIFELLGAITLPSVQFTSFTYGSEIPPTEESEMQIDPETGMPIPLPPKPAVYSISMSGTADSFESISLQTRLFRSNKYIKSSSFSSFSINEETGGINFEVKAVIDPQLISYPAHVARADSFEFEQAVEEAVLADENEEEVEAESDAESEQDTEVGAEDAALEDEVSASE